MKLVLFLVLCVSMLDAIAQEPVKVKRMIKEAGYHSRHILKTNLSEKISLDCQSFVQGIFLGETGAETVIQLDEWECEEVQGEMKASLMRLAPYCLEIDFSTLHLTSYEKCSR